jgi:thymidylate synthase (FAD)
MDITNLDYKLFEHGFVRLDGAMASDLSVVNSARVSFDKYQYTMDENGSYLIKFLMKHRHGTPFEHNSFRFHVSAPIFVVREWQRHRIGSFNEMSGRYVELQPNFYIPDLPSVRKQEGRPGAYQFTRMPREIAGFIQEKMRNHYEAAFDSYLELLAAGVAKELARLVLPLATFTTMFWTVNARSLMNFLSLRNSPEAMYEIRQYAKYCEIIFRALMPITWRSFMDNGRVAP